MAETQNFRTALNGFNRQDVVRYIEYLNNRHAAEIDQLNAQLQAAQAPKAPDPKLYQQLEEEKAKNEALEQTVADLREALAGAPDSSLEQQLEVEKARNEVLEKTVSDLQSALVQIVPAESPNSQELEAYRRAERMEREAQERAERIERRAQERANLVHTQVDAILADTTLRISTSASQILAMVDQAAVQLQQCQDIIATTKTAFAEASSSIAAISQTEQLP